ncbi:hypothetical protein Lal_00044110 [Lupinus albus]|uniref:Putative pectinesterase inhibitor domain-containing protein n=1 Tax=Lupinus albus TaxID=3870 RepID=A0A6A5PFK1_LUPAL|nr:putative pectinesterase inhibitor domain-containing protein [Lupinus albus]KAE9599222.1 putative pectinesterase inhibitor domain-containing protein [Lupinus albus]KAF1895259.1 hypothetical protein Lal_00043905 [Lupinus albus]KAF1895460.1 hypothetical protein Lal_00044110 [Lupinus albus]
MKITNQTLFSIILICFALVGKSMSHVKPSTTSPSASPTETPSTSPTTTPSASSPTSSSSSPTSSPSDQFSDTPSVDPPSDSPAPTPEAGASGSSSSSSASFSDYLKEKYGDQSKTEFNPSLQKICGHTHHIDVCLATIAPLVKKKFDVVNVLEASIKVSKQNIKSIVEKIEKQAKESRENAASLKDCKEHYSKALDNLHKALEAIRAKNYGKVTILLSGALADVSTAESKIVDMKLTNLKVESFSFASVTASNCLSIASLVPN